MWLKLQNLYDIYITSKKKEEVKQIEKIALRRKSMAFA
jgi:plasmid maintenance system antidote protein VapI